MSCLLKTFLAAIVVVFLALFVISFLPAPAAEQARASDYFSSSEIVTGKRYAFGRALLFWGATALELGFLLVLVATGAARRMTDGFGHWIGYGADAHGFWRWLATLLLVGIICAVLQAIVLFPVGLVGHMYAQVWNTTQQPFADWMGQYLLATAVGMVTVGVPFVGLYLLMRWFPRTWYLWAAVGGTLLGFAFAYLAPLVIAPLFNQFTPLSKSEKYASLEPRLRSLANKAGIPVGEIYVMDASRQSTHSNAYFTGLGATQSIVLYDTLLEKHKDDPDEVESILAHEMGHWQHSHIIQGVLLGGLASLVGLIVLDRLLRWFRGREPVRLTGLADPAGLPLILLLGFLGSWIAMPLANAVSRHFERQADRTSLELAGSRPFIAAEKRLAVHNHGNVVPAPWNVWLYATHPTAIERIEMAKAWEEKK
jgi:STE24 endopeptidase